MTSSPGSLVVYGSRVCPSLDKVYTALVNAIPTMRRTLWLFCFAAALSLRAMELRYIHPDMIVWKPDIECYEIHFPRHAVKRDSWLRLCPEWATPWIVAFKTFYKDHGHPLNMPISEYRASLRDLLDGAVAASARHVGASYAYFMGKSFTTISAYLGHKTQNTVETYVHFSWQTSVHFHDLLEKHEEYYGKSFIYI